MKTASVVVIEKDGKYLAINRKNAGQFGLPGGKSEFGETLKQTAIRECFEETGIKIKECFEIYSDVVVGEVNFKTSAFFVKSYDGDVVPSEEGDILWVSQEILTDKEKSPFYKYNIEVFKCIRFLN